jgi:type II secretory pathway predicted ATPase ExeA/septal ring-binding cell division protein DamX
MYLGHFGLTEPPFRITPHTDFFFDGANRGPTLEGLLYAVVHDEGIVKVTGEVGSGKTMLCRVLMERLPASVETIYLANPSLSRDEILYAIADELKIELGALRPARLLHELQEQLIARYAAGRRVVVLIDEAHAMPRDTLEEVRLLSNLESGRHKLLQIVLFGQPELGELLAGSDMRQLKERITHSFRLEPMVKGDIESYIDFRMRAAGYRGPKVFTPRAVRRIAAASEGLTRRVNILADKSLLAAFADGGHAVTEREARAAIRDSDFHRPATGRNWRMAAGVLMLGLVLGALGARLWPSTGSASTRLALPLPASATASVPTAPATPAPPAGAGNAVGTVSAAAASPAATAGAAASSPTSVPSVPSATPRAALPTSPAAVAPGTAPATPAPASAGSALVPAAGSAASAALAAASSTPGPPHGQLSRQVFTDTQDWLRNGKEGYSIQLLTVKADEIEKMERFLARASNEVPLADLHLYSVKIDGVQHFRATYGLYRDKAEIARAIKVLPDTLAAQEPFPRSLTRMRSQNSQ